MNAPGKCPRQTCSTTVGLANLDRKNPNAATDFEHLPPEQLADDILKKEQRITEIMAEIKAQLAATS